MDGHRFVSEPIKVDVSSMSAAEVAAGAPSCPRQFVWRGETHRVLEILAVWRKVNDEGYVAHHSFLIHTDRNMEMVLRFQRDGRDRRPWRIFTFKELDR